MFPSTSTVSPPKTHYIILWVLCLSHLFNDAFQALISAALPLLNEEGVLRSLSEVGLVVAVFQISTSIGQPFVGWFTDKHPQPYLLPTGMIATLLGTLLFAYAWSFPVVLISVACFGVGAAVYHPEAARLVYIASGTRPGFAQSLFQTGGNVGAAISPLLVALMVTPYGQKNIAWFALLVGCMILWIIPVSRWHGRRLKEKKLSENVAKRKTAAATAGMLSRNKVFAALFVLLLLVFSKTLYTSSFHHFLTFYLIQKFGVSVQQSQLFLFVFSFAVAAGTMVGGPIGDRIGRKWVIWCSILGPAPFALWLPFVDSLWGICLLSMLIGAVMASSFPAILVFAQEMMPGRIGTVGGLFYGLAFGSAAVASAFLGMLADYHPRGIIFVFELCAYMPLMGLLTWFLPALPRHSSDCGSV
jgi:FSR family fosmidomycin resistance protein-like MFS transporter